MRGHDGSEYLVSDGEGSRPRVGYLNVLLSDGSCLWLLPDAVLRLVADSLLRASMLGRAAVVKRLPKADTEGVLLVC